MPDKKKRELWERLLSEAVFSLIAFLAALIGGIYIGNAIGQAKVRNMVPVSVYSKQTDSVTVDNMRMVKTEIYIGLKSTPQIRWTDYGFEDGVYRIGTKMQKDLASSATLVSIDIKQ